MVLGQCFLPGTVFGYNTPINRMYVKLSHILRTVSERPTLVPDKMHPVERKATGLICDSYAFWTSGGSVPDESKDIRRRTKSSDTMSYLQFHLG